VGDKVYFKKPHPCGGHEWEVLRIGMDFRVKCATCGHLLMLPRVKFEKSVKKVLYSKSGENRVPDGG
jgi:hypothetical protein